MKNKINNSNDVAQYFLEEKDGNIRWTKPNSALSLLVKKHAWINNRSRIGLDLLKGFILSNALITLVNIGQITDFYNELYKICRQTKNIWQFNRHIATMISTTQGVKKEWVTFLKKKRR